MDKVNDQYKLGEIGKKSKDWRIKHEWKEHTQSNKRPESVLNASVLGHFISVFSLYFYTTRIMWEIHNPGETRCENRVWQ